MDFFIDPALRTWNSQAIRALVDPQDAKIIESIPLSRNQMVDRMDGTSQIMGNTQLNQDTN